MLCNWVGSGSLHQGGYWKYTNPSGSHALLHWLVGLWAELCSWVVHRLSFQPLWGLFRPPGYLGPVVVVIHLLSHVWLFTTPRTAAHQASVSSTMSQSLLNFMSIESVMLSNHLILCHPHLLLPSIFSSVRVFSNESALPIRWPKYWSFSFSISTSNEYSGLISFKIDWSDLLTV